MIDTAEQARKREDLKWMMLLSAFVGIVSCLALVALAAAFILLSSPIPSGPFFAIAGPAGMVAAGLMFFWLVVKRRADAPEPGRWP